MDFADGRICPCGIAAFKSTSDLPSVARPRTRSQAASRKQPADGRHTTDGRTRTDADGRGLVLGRLWEPRPLSYVFHGARLARGSNKTWFFLALGFEQDLAPFLLGARYQVPGLLEPLRSDLQLSILLCPTDKPRFT